MRTGGRGQRTRYGKGQRGAAMSIVLVFALVGAISSYAMLMLGIAQARQARFYRLRGHARYAAEAGIVWAQQNLLRFNGLWGDPAGDVDLTFGTAKVDVIVPGCAALPCPNRTIQAKVTY